MPGFTWGFAASSVAQGGGAPPPPPDAILLAAGPDFNGRVRGTTYDTNYAGRWSYLIRADETGDWTSLAVHTGSMAGVKDGALFTGGSDTYGILGNGATTGSQNMAQVDAGPGWSQVSISDDGDSAAALKNGGLYVWGRNRNNVLGINTSGADITSPTQIGAATYVSASLNSDSSGYAFWAAVKDDGTLWVCGRNNKGQLGLGDTSDRTTPAQVGAGTDWAEVSCGSAFMVARKTDGTIWSAGVNGNGRTGQGTTSGNTTTITQIGAATDWDKISVSRDNGMAINTSGELYSWGAYATPGSVSNVTSPTQVGVETDWEDCWAISAGFVALRAGSLWTWGYAYNGNLHTNVDSSGIGGFVDAMAELGSFSQVNAVVRGTLSSSLLIAGIPSGTGNLASAGAGLPETITDGVAHTFDAINYIGEPPVMPDFSYVKVLSATVTGTWSVTVDNDFDVTVTPDTETTETVTVTYTADGTTSVGTRAFAFDAVAAGAGITLSSGFGTYDLSAYLDPFGSWMYDNNDPDIYVGPLFDVTMVDIDCFAFPGASGTIDFTDFNTVSIPYTVS